MTMKEVPYPAHGKELTLLVCSKCSFDTFDKETAKTHDALPPEEHKGPSSAVPQ